MSTLRPVLLTPSVAAWQQRVYSSSAKPAVLLVGLTVQHALVPRAVGVKVAADVDQAVKDATSTGYSVEVLRLAPEDEGEVKRVQSKLKERHWDGICIGWGLRALPVLTPFLEDLINGTVEVSPKTRIVFNTGPKTILQAIQRNFPLPSH